MMITGEFLEVRIFFLVCWWGVLREVGEENKRVRATLGPCSNAGLGGWKVDTSG